MIKDKKGNRISVGRPRPNITGLVGQQLNARGIYRVLSSVAHCDPTAVSRLGFAPAGSSRPGGVIKKLAINHDLQSQLRVQGVEQYARAVWPHIVQYGVDRAAAAAVLEDAYGSCGIPDSDTARFWRRT